MDKAGRDAAASEHKPQGDGRATESKGTHDDPSYVSWTLMVEGKNQQPKLPVVCPVFSHSRVSQANTQELKQDKKVDW